MFSRKIIRFWIHLASGFILQSPILDQNMMTSFIGPYFKKILDQDEFNARRRVLSVSSLFMTFILTYNHVVILSVTIAIRHMR